MPLKAARLKARTIKQKVKSAVGGFAARNRISQDATVKYTSDRIRRPRTKYEKRTGTVLANRGQRKVLADKIRSARKTSRLITGGRKVPIGIKSIKSRKSRTYFK